MRDVFPRISRLISLIKEGIEIYLKCSGNSVTILERFCKQYQTDFFREHGLVINLTCYSTKFISAPIRCSQNNDTVSSEFTRCVLLQLFKLCKMGEELNFVEKFNYTSLRPNREDLSLNGK